MESLFKWLVRFILDGVNQLTYRGYDKTTGNLYEDYHFPLHKSFEILFEQEQKLR